jgi:hypothetical protein
VAACYRRPLVAPAGDGLPAAALALTMTIPVPFDTDVSSEGIFT